MNCKLTEKTHGIISQVLEDAGPFRKDESGQLNLHYDEIVVRLKHDGCAVEYIWQGEVILVQETSAPLCVGGTLRLSGMDGKMPVSVEMRA